MQWMTTTAPITMPATSEVDSNQDSRTAAADDTVSFLPSLQQDYSKNLSSAVLLHRCRQSPSPGNVMKAIEAQRTTTSYTHAQLCFLYIPYNGRHALITLIRACMLDSPLCHITFSFGLQDISFGLVRGLFPRYFLPRVPVWCSLCLLECQHRGD